MSLKEPKYRSLYLYDALEFRVGVNLELVKNIIEINHEDQQISQKLRDIYNAVYCPEPIKLNINCQGGSVYAGLGLIDIISTSVTPVHTHVSGFAASMAVSILLAGAYRTASKNSTIMIHQVSTVAFGDITSVEEDLDEAKRLNNILFELILTKSNITKNDLESMKSHKKDWYISAQEALELGLIDKIID
jgi:ATP-dependent Clp protease protease subunit